MSWRIAAYILAMSTISLAALLLLRTYHKRPIFSLFDDFVPDHEFLSRDCHEIVTLGSSFDGIYGNLDTNNYVFIVRVDKISDFIASLKNVAILNKWKLIDEEGSDRLIYHSDKVQTIHSGYALCFYRMSSADAYICALFPWTENFASTRAWQEAQVQLHHSASYWHYLLLLLLCIWAAYFCIRFQKASQRRQKYAS